jgi:hypothetical protein
MKVVLLSSDDQRIEVDSEVLRYSSVLNNMLIARGLDNPTSSTDQTPEIRVVYVNGECLEYVVNWCQVISYLIKAKPFFILDSGRRGPRY